VGTFCKTAAYRFGAVRLLAVSLDGMMYVIMRGQWIAAASWAAASSWVREAWKVASSFPEFDRKIDDAWPDLKAGQVVVCRADAGLHGPGRSMMSVPGKANWARPSARSQASEHDLATGAVQGEEHVALAGESSGERGCDEQLTK